MDAGVAIATLLILGAAYLLLTQEGGSPLNVLVDSFAGIGDPGSGGGPLPVAPVTIGVNKVVQFSQAIAHAEGFGIPGTVPTRFHNPGDLGPGDGGSECLSSTFTAGSNVCLFKDDATGWALLYKKIQRIFDGRSSVYNINMTIEEFGKRYASDWQNWSRNVAAYLGVSPKMTVREWLAL